MFFFAVFIDFWQITPLDSSGCFKVHSNTWLGDLQAGDVAEVLQWEKE